MISPAIAPTFSMENVPPCLRQLPQWVGWKVIQRKGKPTKCPVIARNGMSADTTAPVTWTTFDEALAAFQADKTLAGIGFVFTPDDGLCGVDLDDSIDLATGELKPWAREIVERLDSYTEVSPSGHGVKIFLRAHKPGGRCRKGYHDGGVEMYDSGRFFTVTSQRIDFVSGDVESRQEGLEAVYRLIIEDTPRPLLSNLPLSDGGVVQQHEGPASRPDEGNGLTSTAPVTTAMPMTKFLALIENDPRFKKTWDRKRDDLADQSASTYDLALANAAVQNGWTDGEIGVLIFAWRQEHGEDLDKARRPDYLARTIAKAREAGRAMQRDEALATIGAMLQVLPRRVVQRIDDETSEFFIDIGTEDMLGLGGPETILSGAKLQQRLMASGHMIRRHRVNALERLGTALLAVAEVEQMPRSCELVEDHIRRLLGDHSLVPIDPQNRSWFTYKDEYFGHTDIFRAIEAVPGDEAAYPRLYICLAGIESYLRMQHIQTSGKSLAVALSHGGWKSVKFQDGGRSRRLWRSPPGFVTEKQVEDKKPASLMS
jgi:hypothetical protein